jgi:serine/threonine-protein kinase HipA
VQWFFDNLLVIAMQVLAKDQRLDKEDAFGLLELYGAESACALTLLHADQAHLDRSAVSLPFKDLSERIRNLSTIRKEAMSGMEIRKASQWNVGLHGLHANARLSL